MTTATEIRPEVKAEKPKRWKVTIHSINGDNSDVVVGHNFKINQYKRNVEVEMDDNYLEVLKGAVVHTTVQDQNGVETEVSIPMHAYTVHGPA